MNHFGIYVIIFVLGVSLGRLFNDLIYCLPRKKSLFRYSKNCVVCGNILSYHLRIPIISYLLFWGKCQSCQTRLPYKQVLIELLTGILISASFIHFGFNIKGIEIAILSVALLIVFFINIEFIIIPDEITLPGILIGFIISIFPGAYAAWFSSLLGIILGGLSIFILSQIGLLLFKKEAIGFGDVKITAMLGAFLGWRNVFLILLLSIAWGLLVGFFSVFVHTKRPGSSYIPSAIIGAFPTILVIYFGAEIINAYLTLLKL
jgi:leader peptidase (prepilin peptidase) / N-methyltransferase